MKLRPILNRLLVKSQEPETQTSGGIIIANAHNEGIVQGEVLASGPGANNEKGKFIPNSVESGSKILFHIGSGQTITYEDEEYIMLPEEDVIAVLS